LLGTPKYHEGRPVDGRITTTKESLDHAQNHKKYMRVLRRVADIASSQLRSRLAKLAGTIPSVAASEISFSDDLSPLAFSVIYGSAVWPPYIVTATMTISCPMEGPVTGESIVATPVRADIRKFGGDSEVFEVEVDFLAESTTLHIRSDEFHAAFKQARARLDEHPSGPAALFPG
jgi:hypothetical protein